MKLYRYISFEDFTRIVTLNKDRAARPVIWKDSYEGYLFKYMDNENLKRKLVSSIYWYVCPRNYRKTIENYFKLWHSRWWTYAQCWTKQEESELMWRANSYGNHAIKIESEVEDIKEIMEMSFDKNYFGLMDKEVKYDLKSASDETLRQQIDELHISLAVNEPYFHKAECYSSEYEYRFTIQDNRLFQIEELACSGALYKINEKINNLNTHDEKIEEVLGRISKFECQWREESIDNNLFFDIEKDELSKYIHSVVVHPDAEDWYVELVKEMCNSTKINFEKKSNLYDKLEI